MKSPEPQAVHRGAVLYITVLSTALIVSLLGLTSLNLVRIERQKMAFSTDRRDARANACSAVELALRVMANDPNWRTTYTNGLETTPQSLGPNAIGTLSWILEDSDGSLTDADTNLRLKGVGRVGNTVQVSSVEIVEHFVSTDYLRTPVHCTGTLTLKRESSAIGGPYSANGNLVIADSDPKNGNAEAAGYTGDISALNGTFTVTAAKDLPPNDTFDMVYRPLATEVLWENIPTQSSFSQISGTLSPTNNPYGPLNANGVYYIHIPVNGKLKLKNFALSGTLLLEMENGAKLNSSTIDSMEPFNPNYPVLLIKTNGLDVDADLAGSLGVATSGLIHLIGEPSMIFSVGARMNHVGTIVSSGNVVVGARKPAVLTHDPLLESNPPLGYATTDGQGPQAVKGTWLWDAP